MSDEGSVSIIDPAATLILAEMPDLETVASEVRGRLQRVLKGGRRRFWLLTMQAQPA